MNNPPLSSLALRTHFLPGPGRARCAGDRGDAPPERARLTRSAAARAGRGPPRPPGDWPAPGTASSLSLLETPALRGIIGPAAPLLTS